MFTGIVVDVGTVKSITDAAYGGVLRLASSRLLNVKVSDSVSVNGVCLTVSMVEGKDLWFDVVRETLSRTTTGMLRSGDTVNLELSIGAGEPMGGHFVQGHVDAVGKVMSINPGVDDRSITVQIDESALYYVVEKGSIALNGVSLTVASVSETSFTVKIVPYTWEHTALREMHPGASVNVETDILARYIAKFVPGAGVKTTFQRLQNAGFLD